VHKKWSEKESPEELKEDLEAMKEERELSEQLKGPGPLCNTSGNIFRFQLATISAQKFCHFGFQFRYSADTKILVSVVDY
jgi:hypothetical protein